MLDNRESLLHHSFLFLFNVITVVDQAGQIYHVNISTSELLPTNIVKWIHLYTEVNDKPMYKPAANMSTR